mmetsp:Transcript_29706/g.66670  ORF Transcript_29706/g.66670 Transcript_29706/m.66670 type:complete len:98 (+) Transcript_29706:144-437(+)
MIPSLAQRHVARAAAAGIRRGGVGPGGARPLSSASASGGGRGAGIFARIGSFLVGAGMTALVTEVYVFAEVREGNLQMLRKQREIEDRLAALEKRKK